MKWRNQKEIPTSKTEMGLEKKTKLTIIYIYEEKENMASREKHIVS